MKKCFACKILKPSSEFTRKASLKDGLNSICRVCRKAQRRYHKSKWHKAQVFQKKVEVDSLRLENKKRCCNCMDIKSLSEFHKKKGVLDEAQSFCKTCGLKIHAERRKNNPGGEKPPDIKDQRKRLYGIAPEDFDQIILNQGGKCAICQLPFIKTPHLDHDHRTGKVRGVLCRHCNPGLGLFKDSPEALRAAADYLEKS